MLIALLTDLHANREAVTACLADAARRNADRYVFLGDLVGYGAEPGWVVDRVIEYVGRGALVVQGNHDYAASGGRVRMNETARFMVAWTSAQLTTSQRDFLQKLPRTIEEDGRLFVHASAYEPESWHYVSNDQEARRSLAATTAQQTYVGHLHIPGLYHLSLTGKLFEFKPVAGAPIPLLRGRRWLAVLGAVGQPRDRNPAACYALLDDTQNTLTYIRVPYDVQTAARKVREADLPEVLAARLERGY